MTKPYNTDIAHVWTRVRRSFHRKGLAFKKDGFITKKKESDPDYKGSTAGAELRGAHALHKKAKEWRTDYLKNLELGEDDAQAYLKKVAKENGMSPEDIVGLISEADAQDAEKVKLFNAILDQKPHDAKAATDTLLKDKLADALDTYKSDLALKIFNPPPPEVSPEEGEAAVKEEKKCDDKDDKKDDYEMKNGDKDDDDKKDKKKKFPFKEQASVLEMLRAPGKDNQQVNTNKTVSPMQKHEPRSLKKK